MRKKSFAVIYAAAVLALGMLIPRGGSLLAAETPEPAVETAAETTPETAAAGSGDADTGRVADASEMTEVVDVTEEGMVPVPASELKDGTYAVEMKSSSSMFKADHVELKVAEGRMEAVLYMTSKSYLYMFAGTAEEAAAAGEDRYLKPEEVSGDMRTFTLPVEALDAAGNYAAFSKKKEKWYDRTLLFRADSLPEEAFLTPRYTQLSDLALEDGEYTVEVTLEGGSGKASVASPAKLHVSGGTCTAEIIWSSSNYDYMMVEDARYDPVDSGEGSAFEIPVKGFDFRMPVQADTTAMSQPYLIDYTLYFDSTTITAAAENAAASVDMGESRGNEEQAGDTGENAGDTGTEYADQFSVESLTDGCFRITIGEDAFLLVPEGQEAPADAGIPVLQQPLNRLYVASSSVMDLLFRCGAQDSAVLTGTAAGNWSIPEIREAVETGKILYAGKYSAPDYERILEEGCDLAVENTMIYHCPEVKEQLERLGIPVLVERSSYESHPLGRLEWIRLYGLLTGHREEAEAFFADSAERFRELEKAEASGKTAAFFYITSTGAVNVRRPGDYISRMIELAGGKCLPLTFPGEDSASSTVNMQMEAFYAAAVDADVLIYNSTVAGELETLDDLREKSPLMAELKAVREGNVWCTEQNMFQEVSGTVELMEDLHAVFSGEERELRYLHRLT